MRNWNVIDEEWQVLAALLPKGWREMARTTGAIRHEKGVTDPDMLLRLLLLHVGGGLSLRSAAARAPEIGLPQISDVALLKRLRSSEVWLRTMAAALYRSSPVRRKSHRLKRRVRAVDATRVVEPGKTGSEWRVHYSIDLSTLACDFYELTDVKGGETYRRIPVEQGDVILGDRGYCHREGVAHVRGLGGDVVVRLNSTNFPLLTRTGSPFDLLAHLRKLRGHTVQGWNVMFEASQEQHPARLCAVRKSRLAAEREKAKIVRANRKKKVVTRPETLECVEYVFVLTTLDASTISASETLNLYRTRWQIELVFKRMKSLMNLGHLPKHSDASSKAWIEGKLLTVLLTERLMTSALALSPWGYEIEEANAADQAKPVA